MFKALKTTFYPFHSKFFKKEFCRDFVEILSVLFLDEIQYDMMLLI